MFKYKLSVKRHLKNIHKDFATEPTLLISKSEYDDELDRKTAECFPNDDAEQDVVQILLRRKSRRELFRRHSVKAKDKNVEAVDTEDEKEVEKFEPSPSSFFSSLLEGSQSHLSQSVERPQKVLPRRTILLNDLPKKRIRKKTWKNRLK